MIYPPEKNTRANSEIDRTQKVKKTKKPKCQQEAIFKGLTGNGVQITKSSDDEKMIKLEKDGAVIEVPLACTKNYESFKNELTKQQAELENAKTQSEEEPEKVNKTPAAKDENPQDKNPQQPNQEQDYSPNLGGGIDNSRSILLGLLKTMAMVLLSGGDTKKLPEMAQNGMVGSPVFANNGVFSGYNYMNPQQNRFY